MLTNFIGSESVIIVIALAIGSISDIRSREIPDLLSFCLVAIAFIWAINMSIIMSDYMILLSKFLGFVVAGIIGLLLYFLGQWGGGDAKIIMGVGAILGIDLVGMGAIYSPVLMTFLLNTIFVGALYGVVWIIFISLTNFKQFKKQFNIERTKGKNLRLRKYLLLGTALFIIVIIVSGIDELLRIFLLLVAFFAFFAFYSSIYISAVEKSLLIKNVKIMNLTEGDWLVEDVRISNGRTFKSSRTGVSLEDIELLKKSGVKTVKVREGIPFVPSFLFAYIVTIILGNWPIIIANIF